MKKQAMESYKVTGWVCDIAARHELGETDVTIYPTKAELLKDHSFAKECGGCVKLTITYSIPK
jgi:hypothetical protein